LQTVFLRRSAWTRYLQKSSVFYWNCGGNSDKAGTQLTHLEYHAGPVFQHARKLGYWVILGEDVYQPHEQQWDFSRVNQSTKEQSKGHYSSLSKNHGLFSPQRTRLGF